MTQTITTKRTTIATALAAVMIALSLAATSQAHDVLGPVKEKYAYQKKAYHKAYLYEVKSAKAAYRNALSQASADHRAAVRLCEPERSLVLAKIRAAKREAASCYREDLLVAKKDYRYALAELEAWYAQACRPHQHAQQVVVVKPAPVVTHVVPKYVVKKTTTTVTSQLPAGAEFYPNDPTAAPHASTHTSGHASEWELIAPEATGPVLEGPVLEGPILEGPILEGPILEGPTFEGPVLEGPRFEGPVLEGPSFEGPVFPQPQSTSAIEVVPTVTTKVVEVTHVTKNPTVVVTKPAVHVTPVVVKRPRSAAVGNLVLHALRVFGR